MAALPVWAAYAAFSHGSVLTFMRKALAYVGKPRRHVVSALVRTAFAQVVGGSWMADHG